MRSHLTRGVFRRLLSSQPVVLHRHAHSRGIHSRPQLPSHGRTTTWKSSKRTIFGVLENKPKRDLREPTLDPGMGKMLELDKRIHLIARYPPTEELVNAFSAFLQAKKERKLPMEDFHATQLFQTLKVIDDESEKSDRPFLMAQDYYRVIYVISNTPTQKLAPVHNELLWLAYHRWLTATSNARKASSAEEEQNKSSIKVDFISRMISILCRTRQTREAQKLLEQLSSQSPSDQDDVGISGLVLRLEPRLVDGFARENNEPEMKKVLEKLKSEGRAHGTNLYASLLLHYARKNDIEQAKVWATPNTLEMLSSAKTLTWYSPAELRRELFAFCLRNNEMEWAQTILQTKDGDLDQEAMFLGAAAAGKTIDDFDRMLKVLAQRSNDPNWTPNINTINSLLDFAVTKNDPYTAECYFALAQRWRTPSNAQTYIHQIRYRLLANDINGALSAYALLRQQPIQNNEDLEVMNHLTQTLAASPSTAHETLMGLAADLSDRNTLFPASTVAALCSYHLRRDEYFELVDLLQTYAYQYSTADRIMLRDLLLAVCVDPASDTARVWDTYMIFHQVFDLETDRTPRRQVMEALYARKRPDLATHVFTRTARHSRGNTRPDHDMYVAAIQGIADNAEPEALEVVHNMLKLDTEVEPSTRLRNALMLAYTACGVHWRALEFWQEITASPEGPSYNSLHAAFGACEQTSWGYEMAQAIWARLLKSEVEVTVELLASYVGALAGNGLLKDCVETVKAMEEVTGKKEEEDLVLVFGTLFNTLRGVVQQEEAEDWALEEYPHIWERLREKGMDEDAMGLKKIKGLERRLVA